MKYSIEGEPLPVVICEMEANEMMITEKGAMAAAWARCSEEGSAERVCLSITTPQWADRA